MTLIQVKGLLAGVKQILCLKGDADLSCFKLFQAVERNAPFYRFAERMGFTGPNGRESFRSQYRMVLANLQHEEYNQAILHHLYGSYKYIMPFFDKEIEFKQLIEKIVQLPNINMGINHLEQVAANIEMIKVWFGTVEVSLLIAHYFSCSVSHVHVVLVRNRFFTKSFRDFHVIFVVMFLRVVYHFIVFAGRDS